MKILLTVASMILIGISSAKAQTYYNYNSTTRYNNGYNSNQYYSTPRSNTSVNTYRNYNNYGGYNSSTNVYRNGQLKTSSQTYKTPYGGTSTYKYNYNTGRSSYKFSR